MVIIARRGQWRSYEIEARLLGWCGGISRHDAQRQIHARLACSARLHGRVRGGRGRGLLTAPAAAKARTAPDRDTREAIERLLRNHGRGHVVEDFGAPATRAQDG